MPAQFAKATAKARASNVAQRAGAEAPSGGSRRQILDTAARLLRTHGYHGATLRDIAEAVGIRKASIYHHFASKDEIVETVVNDGVNFVHAAVTKALSDLPAGASARARLSAEVKAHLLALLEHSDYTSASIKVFSQVPRRVAARVRRVRRRYENVWRAIFADLKAQGALSKNRSGDIARLMLLGAMNWSSEWYRSGHFSIDEIADEFVAAMGTLGHRDAGG